MKNTLSNRHFDPTKKDANRYDDMIHMTYHPSETHPRMSVYNRAAQFSPFAALTGFEESVAETARLTDQKIILDENEKSILDGKFQMILERINDHPTVSITYFVPDDKKEGGSYHTENGRIKKIRQSERQIILGEQGSSFHDFMIDIDQIIDIDFII